MTSEHDFYLQRDQRTVYYIQGATVEPRPVQICWGEDAARSPAHQMLLLALSNQLARFCRCAGFSGPDAPLLVPVPLGGTSLHEAITMGCHRIDPCGRWLIGEAPRAMYRLAVGRQSGRADIFLGTSGWLAYAVDQATDLPLHTDSAGDMLGAGMAACIGAANAFKVSLGLRQPLIHGTFSLWSFGRNSQALQGLPLVATELGDVLMVGAGAVATALVYWLNFLPISGRWDIMDHDEVQLNNSNRGLLFTAEDAGWEGRSRQRKASVLSRYLAHAHPTTAGLMSLRREGSVGTLFFPWRMSARCEGFCRHLDRHL